MHQSETSLYGQIEQYLRSLSPLSQEMFIEDNSPSVLSEEENKLSQSIARWDEKQGQEFDQHEVYECFYLAIVRSLSEEPMLIGREKLDRVVTVIATGIEMSRSAQHKRTQVRRRNE